MDEGGGLTLQAGWLIPAGRGGEPLVDVHLISRRVYDADGILTSAHFLRRTRTAA